MAGIALWTDGAADGNWATAGNWGTFSGTPSAPPANADGVLINASSRAITLGLSPAANTFAQGVTITDGFTGSIGDATTSLAICCTAAPMLITVAGAYIKIGTGLTTTNCVVNFKSAGEFVASGTFTNLSVGGNGTVTIPGAGVATNLNINGPSVTAASGTAITRLTIGAGSYSGARAITEFEASNCRIVVTGTVATTLAIVGANCTYNHQSTGAITTSHIFSGGTLTLNGSTSSTAISMTTMYKHKGSTISLDGPGWVASPTTTYPVGL